MIIYNWIYEFYIYGISNDIFGVAHYTNKCILLR